MNITKKDIKKVLLDPTVHSSIHFARSMVWIKRDQYKDQGIYFDTLTETIEDLDKILFLIAQLNLEEQEKYNETK